MTETSRLFLALDSTSSVRETRIDFKTLEFCLGGLVRVGEGVKNTMHNYTYIFTLYIHIYTYMLYIYLLYIYISECIYPVTPSKPKKLKFANNLLDKSRCEKGSIHSGQ